MHIQPDKLTQFIGHPVTVYIKSDFPDIAFQVPEDKPQPNTILTGVDFQGITVKRDNRILYIPYHAFSAIGVDVV
jgi:hypothetical protein